MKMQTFVSREEFDRLLEILWEDLELRKKMKERLVLPPKERALLVKRLVKVAENIPLENLKEEAEK